jgi:hypothetical protein
VETKPKPRNTALRVRVNEDDLKRLRRLAAIERRTVSQIVWIAIQDLLEKAEA